MKHTQFVAGFLVGALTFGGGMVFASGGLTATPTDNIVKLDGKLVKPQAYIIDGHNYFQLKDIAQMLDFGLVWDERNNTVNMYSDQPYTEQVASAAGSSGYLRVPQSGERFIPVVGDSILCDDGTAYEIKDMSRYDANMFAKGPLPPLPEPTCDWSKFPTLPMPKIETIRLTDSDGDYLFITNYYEIQRMQYTLYNAIGGNTDTWKNGAPILKSNGELRAKVQFGIPEDDFGTQSFWPWYSDRLTKVFESCPSGTYSLEAWDVYKDGVFLYTEYKFQAI